MTDKTIHEAFHEAYAEMCNPKKNAENPAFRSKYANLEELLNVTRPILAASGFALIQEPVSEDGRIGVHTRLRYKTGEEVDFGSYTVPLSKHDAQGAGSALTYTRRYGIAAIFGLAQEDDDGNAASPGEAPKAKSGSASVKQVGFIKGLVEQLGYSEADVLKTLKSRYGHDTLDELSKGEASEMIDGLGKKVAEVAKADAADDALDEEVPY